MYGISRIDDEAFRTHAWRVTLRRHHVTHVRNFADKKCGGKRKALRLAQAYRDELIRKVLPLTRKEFSGIRRRNNRTGVVGVYRYAKSYTLKDGTVRYCWYWEAIWPTTPGQSEIARFSVNKFGEAGAFNRACSARARGFERIEGVFWPCEPSSDAQSRQMHLSSGDRADSAASSGGFRERDAKIADLRQP
jgi:hypothetical protein